MKRLRVRDGYFRDPDGKPVYLIGANFWPSRTGPWMYRDPWDPGRVEKDIDELHSLGANAVRIFCFLPDFLPSADVVDGPACDRLSVCGAVQTATRLWRLPALAAAGYDPQ